MPKAEIQVAGVRELIRDLKRAGDEDAKAALKAAHKEAAETVAVAARIRAPKVTGKLAGNIRSSSTLRSGRVAAGKKLIPYAGPIHFGWRRRNIKPNPFLYDALDGRRGEVLKTFQEAVADIAEGVKGKSL